MESLNSISFRCPQCKQEHNKYLQKNTKLTTCKNCGFMINLNELNNEIFEEDNFTLQSQNSNNINNFYYNNYMRNFNSPFENGDMYSYQGDKIDYDFSKKNSYLNKIYLVNNKLNEMVNSGTNKKNGNYRIYNNTNRNEINMLNDDINNNNKYASIFIGNNKLKIEKDKIRLMGTVLNIDMYNEIKKNNNKNNINNKNNNNNKIKMTKKLYIKNNNNKEEPPICSICLNNIIEGEEIEILICRHLFHYKCIEEWLKNKKECPFCRKKLIKTNNLNKNNKFQINKSKKIK